MLKILWVACLLTPLAATAAGSTCTVESGAKTLPVVELYTSEGCDSCPPADKWFSQLDAKRAQVVPLAFHVDYWDYLGWKDALAKAAFSERQRATVRRQNGRVSYTPQVVFDGQDLRSWFRSAALETGLAAAQARAPGATLQLQATNVAGTLIIDVRGKLINSALASSARLFVATTESALVRHIAAGENRGVTLRHDHVVRELIGPLAPSPQGEFVVRRNVALGLDWKAQNLAVVAFVQDGIGGPTLQAVTLSPCAR